MDEEEFGSVHIDSYDKSWGTTDRAPAFDYWIYKYRRQKLNDEQKAFLAKMRATLRDGTALKCPGYYGYLNLLRDELIQYRNRPTGRDTRIKMAMNLMSVYGFQDSGLKKMIIDERSKKSAIRQKLFQKETAKWIPVGESLEYSQGTFTRGGFYWGNALKINGYNSQTREFASKQTSIEGPVVSENAITNSEFIAGLPFSTMIEMPENSKQALLKFLQGEEIADKNAISYYLAGMEIKLLADVSTTQEERKELLHYLYTLRMSPSIKCLHLDLEYSQRYDYTSRIENLVDFTMARFFSENPEEVFSQKELRQMPILNRIHVALRLSQFDCKERITESMAKAVADTILLPTGLPDEFEEDFRAHFKYVFKSQESHRTLVEDSQEPEYYPIKGEIGYSPTESLEYILKKPAIRFSPECNRKLGKVKVAYRDLKYDLTYFIAVKQRGDGLLTQKYYLPPWCDPNKLPGFSELQEKMTLAPDEPYRITTVQELMDNLQFQKPVNGTEYLDENTLLHLRSNLGVLNLNLGAGTTGTMKLRYDDTVGIFSNAIPQVPNRGTSLVSLFLMGWLINIDGGKSSDFALIDQWMDQIWGKNKWLIAAKATLRWLAQRKITMTQKRKKKVAQLAAYPNKRDEIMKVLLQLASGENLSPKRMKRLETIYELTGLDPADIHSDLHRMATTITAPKPKRGPAAASGKATIDKTLLRQMETNTQKAQNILAKVFEDESTATVEKEKKAAKEESTEIKLLRQLAQKDLWTRAELEQMCSEAGKTPADVLETLNDLAYERIDEPVAEEDDDSITIDLDVAAQLLN